MPASTKQNVIILLGAPGSGKGTQAKKASKEFHVPHISTGDLFRENLKNKTDLGKNANTYIAAGKLVPDGLVLDMLFDRVSSDDCKNGYFLDGFPRTIPQAAKLEEHLKNNANPLVIHLECSDESVIKRISGRLSCQNCGAVYHRVFSCPKSEGICDSCGSFLIQRIDDREDIVKERLRVYNIQTKPLIEFYQNKQYFININGENSPDIVYGDLIKACKRLIWNRIS